MMQRKNNLPGSKGVYLDRQVITFLYDHASETGLKAFLIFCLKRVIDTGKKRGGKPGKRNGEILNNGEIVFTYDEAEGYGITRPRFSRALKELHGLGLIDVTSSGQGVARVESKYGLSERWKKYNTADFEKKAWPKSSKYTFGFAAKGRKKKK